MEVENFLFGLEQYFEVKGIRDDMTWITNPPTFLQESAQLWWRRKHSDTVHPIRLWDDFKRKLKKQFSPTNAEKEARGRLKQSRSIRDYVKEFTTLTLEIEDMSDKDSLFLFMNGLKDWARVELERRNVQDLDAAITTVKSLADYTQPKLQKDIHEKNGGDESKDHERKDKGRSKSPNGGKPETIKPKNLRTQWVSRASNACQERPHVRERHNQRQAGGAIKAANSSIKPIDGIEKDATVHLGPWSGKLDFSIVPLDDYQVVLGMAFFDQANTFPLPAASSLSILNGGKAHTNSTERMPKPECRMLSAIQLVEKPSFTTFSKNNMPTEGV
ncbi:hypothetical protein EZV62_010956 [Acer yangbiense]|uniref:Retrotransposon gag domain-containing protein n=1 Tax=Acer yangbiense TaxID=1000413 RepID=A0A5C7I606_9ROSI|nr:hypothetical protein EZV62_010956 [Acer yangbiense]